MGKIDCHFRKLVMKYISKRAGLLQFNGLMLGDQGILKYIFGELLDLGGLGVDFFQIALQLAGFIFFISQNICIDLQSRKRCAQIVGHGGDHGLIGPENIDFPFLLLLKGPPAWSPDCGPAGSIRGSLGR